MTRHLARATACWLQLAALSAIVTSGHASTAPTQPLRLRPFSGAQPIPKPWAFAASENAVYVLDDLTNRLFILDCRANLIGVAGAIGSQPGQFYHPNTLGVSEDGVVVVDSGNARAQYFSKSGEFKSQFPIPERLVAARSAAIDRRGWVYFSDPESGHLVTVYDQAGRVARSFGDLTVVSRLYNGQDASRDQKLRFPANRVWIALGERGSVYVSFFIAPVIRKYAADGRLVFERGLSGVEAEHLAYLFWRSKPGTGGMLKTAEGDQEFDFITRAIGFDREGKRLYVLGGTDVLFELDSEGRQLGAHPIALRPHPEGRSVALYHMDVDGGHFFFQTIFTPGLFHGSLRGGRRTMEGCRRARGPGGARGAAPADPKKFEE